MSQIKIQEYIVQEIHINHIAGLKKGQTIARRDERSAAKWTQFLTDRGYTAAESAAIFNDAKDVALLELRAA